VGIKNMVKDNSLVAEFNRTMLSVKIE